MALRASLSAHAKLAGLLPFVKNTKQILLTERVESEKVVDSTHKLTQQICTSVLGVSTRMRRGGGKGKGSSFERQICKRLSLWVSHGKREDLFWRSAMSGGRATVGRKQGKDHAHHAGDISATHPDGHKLTDHWYVECKAYKNLRIESALIDGTGTLAGFWKETCKQATLHHKLPMLIAKQNNTKILMAIPHAGAMNPYGTDIFRSLTMLLRSHVLRSDIYDFDAVLAVPFTYKQASYYSDFLRPGELERILGMNDKVVRNSIKRNRLHG